MTSAELERIHAEISKLIDETGKLNEKNRKMNLGIFWYPLAISIGLIGVVATLTTLLIKFF